MFKAKLRRIGNSQGIYIPKDEVSNYKIGDMLEVEVITKGGKSPINAQDVITQKTERKRLVMNPKTGLEEWK